MSVGRCCCGCEILEDDFTRADDADPGTNWEERSGTWAIASNNLRCTAAGLIVATKTYSNAIGAALTAILSGRTVGDIVRLVFDYLDDDNYHFAEFTINALAGGPPGANTIRLGKREATVEAWLEPAELVDDDSDLGIIACFKSDWFAAMNYDAGIGLLFPNPFGAWAELAGTLGGNRVGFEVVNLAGASIDFTAMKLHKTSSDCEYCSKCSACRERGVNVPEDLQVVIAGGAVGACDGTFSIPLTATETASPSIFCTWLENFGACGAGDCFTTNTVSAQLTSISGGFRLTIVQRLVKTAPFVFVAYTWQLDLLGNSPHDCLNWASLNIALASAIGTTLCGALGTPTCAITSL